MPTAALIRSTTMSKINTWKKFAGKVRKNSPDLLTQLASFNDAVLVTGCQRSGTTALTSVISTSEGMVDYSIGGYDELTAALILSGELKISPEGRFCFQTTYLNERYTDYYKHINDRYKIIWIIRNPFSVVYSMLHGWGRGSFAFNELFNACGYPLLTEKEKINFKRFGRLSINRARKASMSYIGKNQQLLDLEKKMGSDRILVIDYDELVRDKNRILNRIYGYINLPFDVSYAEKLHANSINKADRLTGKEVDTINNYCMPMYLQIKRLAQ